MNGITITINAETAAGLAELQKFFKAATGGLDKLAGASHFLRGLGATLASTFTVESLVHFIRETINLGDELNKLRQRTGIAVDLLDALRRQGEVNNLVFEDLALGLRSLNDRIYTAAKTGGPAAQVFRDLGVSVTDATGRLRPTQAILLDIATAFQQMGDGQRKTSLAIDLFSRNGDRWIPLLNQGADGMQRMREQGGGITPEMAADAEEFNDSLTKLRQTLQQIFIVVATQILPNLKQFTGWLKQSATDTNSVNLSATGLVDVFKTLATVLVLASAQFVTVGEIIGRGVFIVFKLLADQVKELILLFRSMATVAVDAGKTMFEALSGRFDEARANLRKTIGDVKTGLALLGGGFVDTMKDALNSLTAAGNSIINRFLAVARLIKVLWAEANPKTSGTDDKKNIPDNQRNGEVIVSDESRKIADAQDANLMARLQARQKAIEGTPGVSEVEKARELVRVLGQQRELIASMSRLNQNRANDPSLDPMTRLEADREKVRLDQQDLEIQRQMQQLQGQNSFGFQFGTALTDLRNQWGTWAQQAASSFKDVFNSGISSISDGITGLIMQTKSWDQALTQIGTSILTSIVSAIVQMGVRWIATRVLMATVGKTIESTMLAATIPIATATSVLWAVPATLATIATYGGAAAAAPGLISLAEGLVSAGALAGFAEGGRPPVGQLSVVGEEGPELFVPDSAGTIIPNDRTRTILESSGRVPNSTPAQNRPVYVALLDDRQAYRQFIESHVGEEIITKIVHKHRLDLGHDT